MKIRILLTLIIIFLAALSPSFAGKRNLAPDAMTRATTFNEYMGDLAFLFDGKHPGNESSSASFVWQSQGILVFEFSEPVVLVQFRVFVGSCSGRYTLKAYIGGRTLDDGAGRDPEGILITRMVLDEDFSNEWVTFELPLNTVTDNVEFQAAGRSEYHEIELIGPEETPLHLISRVHVKT